MKEYKSVFEYRAPTDKEKEALAGLQTGWLYVESLIMQHVPVGQERSLAITKLQECRMWANAGVVLVQSKNICPHCLHSYHTKMCQVCGCGLGPVSVDDDP